MYLHGSHNAKTENWISGDQASKISDVWSTLFNLEDLNIFIIIINNMRRSHLSVLDLRNMVTTAIEEGCRKQEKGRKPWVAFTSDNLWLKWLIPCLSFSFLGAPDAQVRVWHNASDDGSVNSRALEETGQHPRIRRFSNMLHADSKIAVVKYSSYIHRQDVICALLT